MVNHSSIYEFTSRLEAMSKETLDKNTAIWNYNRNCSPRLKTALYHVLAAKKDEIANSSTSAIDKVLELSDSKHARLNNILESEGIIGYAYCPLESSDVSVQQKYENSLNQLREFYCSEMRKCDYAMRELSYEAANILKDHYMYRPISNSDENTLLKHVESRFSKVKLEIKSYTCEKALTMRSRIIDTRRRRRNFSKTSTSILNEYFYTHLANQYPSEEIKMQLAQRCGMTIAQVSNWFGNKRIRHKRKSPKAEMERKMFCVKSNIGFLSTDSESSANNSF
ncbi:PBC domain-containing protein [Ditylenchus destructor]|uniref:PBC domain-containing protein n=1 Tax=Ditylenchus destructor TaxID=166010 RepID=A0AAD4RDE7_9BILA|nr:PBC domain-containing protein [Ditylenchus destructor]